MPPFTHTPERITEICYAAIDWALAHGLIVRPSIEKQAHFTNNAAATHAPFALCPTPFPRGEFEKAKGLQKLWNSLIHEMSRDSDFIHNVITTLSQDEFIRNLYSIYCTIQNEGVQQPTTLGIHRCDYLLHAPPGTSPESAIIQQVEFNTIASSFGCLSSQTSQLHRYLLSAFSDYGNGQIKLDQLPENRSLESICGGLSMAWKHYRKPDACILMIVQPLERNAFDQRLLEYYLMEKFGIRMLRRSLSEVARDAKIDPNSKILTICGQEIAVAYFRAGYGPEDYPTQQEWDARLMIERSAAIKCPSISYQLVGTKKVQQVLAVSNKLEGYVGVHNAKLLREAFTGLYPLDDSPEGIKAYHAALEHPEKYVMKPQREGGGYNIYGNDITSVISTLSAEERNGYILMDLIQSPTRENVMVREGQVIQGAVISELGIYGIYLSDGDCELLNDTGGHLLRTKADDTKEGGVAAGFAVIDSPLLV